MRAPVNKIIAFSSVDGPGNRTSVFLQGCNFNCRYCHNPETRNLCRACMDCVPKCPAQALSEKDGKVFFDYKKCISCDTCIKTCKYGASPRIRELTPEETMAEIEKQIPYIRGITVSGGECTLHPEFIEELFSLCKKEGLGTLIDSNGTIDFEKNSDLLKDCDGVMLDVKAWDREDHINVTDHDNEMVLKNLDYLGSIGKLYEVRTVVVPGFYDIEKTVENVSRVIAKYLDINDIRYKLITYRPMGVREEFRQVLSVPSKEYMEELKKKSLSYGVRTVVCV
jgi:pyruvate formate lyase activating enzyme